MPTPAAAASSAAWRAVEWRVSAARSASSSRKVASCTSRSASNATSAGHLAGRRVAREHDAAAAARLAHDLVGRDTRRPSRPPGGARSRGPGVTPSSLGPLGVEHARARVLDERVARAPGRRGRSRRRRSGSRRARARRWARARPARAGRPTRPTIGRKRGEQRAQPGAARRRSAARSRWRSANVFSIPGRPSTWSAWKWVRKISSSSTSPVERRSWRWVPSPQSNSRRSPPRRTSVAGRPRRALGAEPAVPTKSTSRSMRSLC